MFLLLYSIVRIFNKQFSLKFYFKQYFFFVYHLALQFYSNRVLFDPTRGYTATADHSLQVNRLYLYNTIVQVFIRTLTFTVLCSYVQRYLVFVIFSCFNTIVHIALDKRRRNYGNTLVLGHSGNNQNWPYDYSSGDGHRRKCVRKSSSGGQQQGPVVGRVTTRRGNNMYNPQVVELSKGTRVVSSGGEGCGVPERDTLYSYTYTHPRGTGGVEEPADRCTAAVCAAGARSR